MTKNVLSVGQCVPDNNALKMFLKRHFDITFDTAEDGPEAMSKLSSRDYDLVTINRKLDCDYTDGVNIIKMMKAEEATKGVPVMLVSNMEDAQQQAVAAGAEQGFGKLEYGKPEVVAHLSKFLNGEAGQ
ncbi:response regulator [Calycomorphotria hydatis]|uniref:Chemotaxis regulatory protein CheY n=1 Tax=Calycomorphotria hydatis TaxID=2528027 RepID=A0A517TBW0_9PLAN|nr:response regulator [Calycomorphotria hydatis]QDT65858.1 chemotaxis regulatory protein CheY [Calycomorphotria hydatis]